MCLLVENSFVEANEAVPPSKLSLIILDEIGCFVQCSYIYRAQAIEVAAILRHCKISKLDVDEDG
jgi:ATP:corrinoid adenosyltransferase